MQIWWSIWTTSLNSELSPDLRVNCIFLGSFTCKHDKHAFTHLSQAFLNPGQSNRCNIICCTLSFPWCLIWSCDLNHTSVWYSCGSMMRLCLCSIFSSSFLLQAATPSGRASPSVPRITASRFYSYHSPGLLFLSLPSVSIWRD